MIEPAARERAVRQYVLKEELRRLLMNAHGAKTAAGCPVPPGEFMTAALGAIAEIAADSLAAASIPHSRTTLVEVFRQMLTDALESLREQRGDGPEAA